VSGRFIVEERATAGRGEALFLVLDTQDRSRPVAQFARRADAEAHAARLETGPFDWDEQDVWKDPWPDDR